MNGTCIKKDDMQDKFHSLVRHWEIEINHLKSNIQDKFYYVVLEKFEMRIESVSDGLDYPATLF